MMPTERSIVYVKPGYHQISVSPGQQSRSASGVTVVSSLRAARSNPASFSPPPGSAKSAGLDGRGQQSAQHAAPSQQAWQQVKKTSPCSTESNCLTPPRPSESPRVADGMTYGIFKSDSRDVSPMPNFKAVTAEKSPEWPSAPSVDKVLASWPATNSTKQPMNSLAHPSPEDVPPWRSPSEQQDSDVKDAPTAVLDVQKSASAQSIASSKTIQQSQCRKGHNGLGTRGLPERMWSQPVPGPVAQSSGSPVDANSAPQSPHHSPSSPSFSSRSNAGSRHTASGTDRKFNTAGRHIEANSQLFPMTATPRGRPVDDVHCRESEKKRTLRDVHDHAPAGDAPSSGSQGSKLLAATGDSSRCALHATQNGRQKVPDDEKGSTEQDNEDEIAPAAATSQVINLVEGQEAISSVTQQDRELGALRRALESERLERKRLEAKSEEAAADLAKGETYLSSLSWELQEVCNQKENIIRQLKDRAEKHDDLLQKVRFEQERRKSLEDELANAAMIRRDLEGRVRTNQGEKMSADLLVKDLQLKLSQFQKDWTAAMPRQKPEELPAGLEVQLEQLRKHLEDTVKVVHHRYSSVTADSFESAEKLALRGSMGRKTSELSNTQLSLLDTTSPCSSRSLEPVAAMPSSSVEEFLPLDHEEELPTEERLIGEWDSPSQASSFVPKEVMWEQLRPGRDCADMELGTSLLRATSAASLSGGSSDSGAAQPLVSRSPIASPPLLPVEDSSIDEASHLALVLPNPARRSSNVLSLRDLSEIKTLKKPPPPIRMLMEICCLLFHIKPVKQVDDKSSKRSTLDYWEPARRYLLSDPFFLSKLRMYEASTIGQTQRNKIRRYFRDPEFSAERVRNCSKAAFELYIWVQELIGLGVPRSSESLADDSFNRQTSE